MAHCGYEATAVTDAIRHPLKAMATAMRAIRTEGPMAPEIPLEGQRPAEFMFDQLVRDAVDGVGRPERRASKQSHAA
jgi:hypothetical protein